jgi:heme/copper-type cytochrome/quinol oxidase subunit 2
MVRLLSTRAVTIACFTAAAAGTVLVSTSLRAAQQTREVSVTGDNYAFSPARIEVQKDDLVKVTFAATDIAHSFTVDGYRIAKRVAAGQTVSFEFRADQAGSFPIYCNLRQEDGCRTMRGELVVHGK